MARVKFSQWTREGLLRAPVFEGLREDASPRSVTREEGADVRSLLGVEAGAAEGPEEREGRGAGAARRVGRTRCSWNWRASGCR